MFLGFTGFFWVYLVCTRFYWVSLDFPGFDWVFTRGLLRFSRFYWVLLGFSSYSSLRNALVSGFVLFYRPTKSDGPPTLSVPFLFPITGFLPSFSCFPVNSFDIILR